MKLFSELGCCCRPTGRRLEPEESPENCVQVVLVGRGDRRSRSMRKRMNESKCWRPELAVILEDRVVSFLESDRDQDRENADRYEDNNEDIVSCKSRSTAKSRRKNFMRMIIQTLSPTPYVFW